MPVRLTVLLLAVSALLGYSAVSLRAHAQQSTATKADVKAEYFAYGDSNAVYVNSPSVAGNVEDATGRWAVGGSYLVDVVTAASVDIVSTATPSWTELRHAGSLSGTYKPGDIGMTVGGSLSREPDYLSLSGGGALSFELLDKALTTVVGYTYMDDTAGRSGTSFATYSLDLTRHAFNLGTDVILDPETTFGFAADAIAERGQQEKPYRYVALFAPSVAPQIRPGMKGGDVNRLRLPGRVAEALPDSRNRFALSARIAQRLGSSTMTIWQRGYADDWGVVASTTDIRYVTDLGKRFFLWPHLRFHAQSGATFWRLAYTGSVGRTLSVPEFRTGDRELSPLKSFTGGIGARWNLTSAVAEQTYSLIFLGHSMISQYSEALFISQREAYFGSLQLEVGFQ